MFKYNGKIWNPKNPEKKLKQLGITWEDVEIIEEVTKSKETEEYADPHRLFYFINNETGYSYSSIYPECNKEGYVPTTLETLEKLWNKNREIRQRQELALSPK